MARVHDVYRSESLKRMSEELTDGALWFFLVLSAQAPDTGRCYVRSLKNGRITINDRQYPIIDLLAELEFAGLLTCEEDSGETGVIEIRNRARDLTDLVAEIVRAGRIEQHAEKYMEAQAA